MRNEDVVATIVQAINEGPIVKRLDKINGTLEDHARHLAAHDTELAVLQRNQHCDASNWGDVRMIIVDIIKMFIVALITVAASQLVS